MTNLVGPSLSVADPDVAQLLDGGVLQGRSVGTTTVQVSSACICVSIIVSFAIACMLIPVCVSISSAVACMLIHVCVLALALL